MHGATIRITVQKFQIFLKSDENKPYFTDTFFNTSHSVILKMTNVSGKICTENENTCFVLCKYFFKISFENFIVYEIMLNNMAVWGGGGRPQMTTRRMSIACWIPKATNTHSQYVILIAIPLQ